MKTKSNNTFYIVLIVILSVAVLGLIALLVVGITNKGFGFSSDNVSSNLVLERDYSIEDLNRIDAKVKAGKVSVYSTQDEKAVVKFYSDKSSAAEVIASNNVLSIVDRNDDCHFICFNFKGVNVEVYIPNSYDGEIKLDVDAGAIMVEDFTAASLNIRDDMGDVTLGVAKNIDARLDMGRLTVVDCLGKINIKNDMGDVEVKNLHLTENSEIKLDMGNVTIDNVGDARVDADVDLGDKDVSGGNYKSDIVLTIQNSLGNITVR